MNALEEQLLRDESGKGKERLSSAKLIMEKDAAFKLKEHNEEKEKLLSMYQSLSSSDDTATTMGIDTSKLLSFEKTKGYKRCARMPGTFETRTKTN